MNNLWNELTDKAKKKIIAKYKSYKRAHYVHGMDVLEDLFNKENLIKK